MRLTAGEGLSGTGESVPRCPQGGNPQGTGDGESWGTVEGRGDAEGSVAALAARGGRGHSAGWGSGVVPVAGGLTDAHGWGVGGDCTELVSRDQWSHGQRDCVTRTDAPAGATPTPTNQSTVPHSMHGELMEEAGEDQGSAQGYMTQAHAQDMSRAGEQEPTQGPGGRGESMGITSNAVQIGTDCQGWDMTRVGGALPGVGTAEKPRQARRRGEGAEGRGSRRRRQQAAAEEFLGGGRAAGEAAEEEMQEESRWREDGAAATDACGASGGREAQGDDDDGRKKRAVIVRESEGGRLVP
jgi:hypothetical protein